MGAMRSLSERCRASHAANGGVESARGAREEPSMEALAGLLWATHVYAREMRLGQSAPDVGVSVRDVAALSGLQTATPLGGWQMGEGFTLGEKDHRL